MSDVMVDLVSLEEREENQLYGKPDDWAARPPRKARWVVGDGAGERLEEGPGIAFTGRFFDSTFIGEFALVIASYEGGASAGTRSSGKGGLGSIIASSKLRKGKLSTNK